MQKKLLLVAYYYPPQPVAGARRAAFLARYLGDFGWSCTVLTRGGSCDEDKTVPVVAVREPQWFSRDYAVVTSTASAPNGLVPASIKRFPGVRHLAGLAKSIVYFPDRAIGWFPNALLAAFRLQRENRFGAVLSSAMPASAHLVASLLAQKFNIPWLADYRDPWTGNRGAEHGPIRNAADGLLERRTLRHASALTTVSHSCARILERLHQRPVTIIPNTYDPVEFQGIAWERPRSFSVCFTGSLQGGKRSPEIIFRAVASLRAASDPIAEAISLHFYGAESHRIWPMAARYGLGDRVFCYGLVDHAAALQAQRSAAMLLILLWFGGSSDDEMGSKIYEYLGAGRPILAIGPSSNVLKDFITNSGCGWFAHDDRTCVDALQRAFREFQSPRGVQRPAHGLAYTARDLVKSFADVLDRISERATA
jgi:glycosyltransferase involved in cell wall biosynthesis